MAGNASRQGAAKSNKRESKNGRNSALTSPTVSSPKLSNDSTDAHEVSRAEIRRWLAKIVEDVPRFSPHEQQDDITLMAAKCRCLREARLAFTATWPGAHAIGLYNPATQRRRKSHSKKRVRNRYGIVQTLAGGAHHHLIIAVLYLTAAIGVVLATDARTLCRGSTIPAPSSPA